MYTSKFWWEVIGEEGEYVRFRHKGHYIRVHGRKVYNADGVYGLDINQKIGYPARLEKGIFVGDYETRMIIYAPDKDCIKPPYGRYELALDRWRKLMGR